MFKFCLLSGKFAANLLENNLHLSELLSSVNYDATTQASVLQYCISLKQFFSFTGGVGIVFPVGSF